MNFVDVAILVVLGLFTLKGLWRGFLQELCFFIGLLAGIFLAVRYHAPLAEWMMQTLDLPAGFCVAVTFSVLLLGTVLFFALLGHLLARLLKPPVLGGVNRLAGGIFGLLQGIMVLAMVLFALFLRPFPADMGPALKASELAPPFVALGDAMFQGGRKVLSERS